MELVGQLAGGIAHDFNNVLSAIIMATDFLLNAHKPTDPSFGDIMQIKQNANRAASLVRHLLAFSRKQTLRPQVLDLGEVLSDLTMLLRRLIGEKVALDVVHGRDLWPVKVDISQFEQVIVNLAVNARDAMPDGGRLQVRTTNVTARECERYTPRACRPPIMCWSRSRDTGTGIPEAIRRQDLRSVLLDQGSRQGHRARPVHGLRHHQTDRRLRVCRFGPARGHDLPHLPAAAYCQRRGRWRSRAEMEAPAISSTLAAADQVKRAAGAAKRRSHRRRHDPSGRGRGRTCARSMRAGLTSRGYTVLEAGNGVEAIEVLEKSGKPVDLVVSDVVMPEMDGPTLARELRSRNPGLKIIFVSGYAEDAFQKNLPEHGQFAFLPKPFTLKQLVAAVKETLAA